MLEIPGKRRGGWSLTLLALVCGLAGLLAACADRTPGSGPSDPDSAKDDGSLRTVDVPALEVLLPVSWADERSGGMIAHDLDGDSRMDLLLTRPGQVIAVSGRGEILWRHQVEVQVTGQSETEGLPGLHGPGVQAGDTDGDGDPEVLYLTRAGDLRVVDGRSGEIRAEIALEPPAGARLWEHLVLASFRGAGSSDLLLQATNAAGYRMGRYIAAFGLDGWRDGEALEPLWSRDDFTAAAHGGARVADLDGDGRHEVVSGGVVGPDGALLYELPLGGHVDAVVIADVRPDLPGLEVVALEEGGGEGSQSPDGDGDGWPGSLAGAIQGGNRVFLFGTRGLVWEADHEHQEPQNAAVGNFLPDRSTLQIWCRTRYDVDQKPFVLDSVGDVIADYELTEVAPDDWTRSGIEVISPIHWSGAETQLIAAKERHEAGDVAVLDPMTGRFVVRIPETADRLYVADVLDDWREELVVISGDRLRVYSNPEANPRPGRKSLWSEDLYRRLKQTWNYYSP